MSSKLELLSQLTIQALSECCPKYEPNGEVYNAQSFDQVDSFTSLGFDVFGSEWFLLYPDILCVIGLEEPRILDRSQNALVRLSEYKIHDQKIQTLCQEEFVMEAVKFPPQLAEQYSNLNKFLVKQKIFHEKDNVENRKQIDVKFPETSFYNFDVGETEHKRIETHVLHDKNPLAIENLWRLVESGTFKSFKQIFDEQDIDDDEEAEENEHKPEHEQEPIAAPAEPSVFLQEQSELFGKLQTPQLNKEHLQQSDFMLEHELTYKMLNANLVQFLPLNLKLQGLRCSFIRLGANEDFFVDLVFALQFAYFAYFKETPKKQRLPSLLTSTSQICSSLLHNYLVHRSTLEQHFRIFSGPLAESFVQLSRKTNNFKVTYQSQGDGVTVTFKRPINYKVGNRWTQQQYPIWTHDRQSLSKSNYIDELLIHLGYDEPVYEEPEEQFIEEEATEPELPKRQIYQYNFAYNMDSYNLDGFVVDGSVEDGLPPEDEESERQKQKQLRRHEKKMQKQQEALQRQMMRDAGVELPVQAAAEEMKTEPNFGPLIQPKTMGFKVPQAVPRMPQAAQIVQNLKIPDIPDFLKNFKPPDMSNLLK